MERASHNTFFMFFDASNQQRLHYNELCTISCYYFSFSLLWFMIITPSTNVLNPNQTGKWVVRLPFFTSTTVMVISKLASCDGIWYLRGMTSSSAGNIIIRNGCLGMIHQTLHLIIAIRSHGQLWNKSAKCSIEVLLASIVGALADIKVACAMLDCSWMVSVSVWVTSTKVESVVESNKEETAGFNVRKNDYKLPQRYAEMWSIVIKC